MTTTEILAGIKSWVTGKLNLKQDVISDLASIRQGAQAGATSVQPSDLIAYFNDARYNTSTHRINFYHGQNVVAYIDASPFIVDGMVDDVRIENGYLVVDFNTASGKQDISIPLTDIFNPNNYYNKTQTDGMLAQKQDVIQDLAAIRTGASAGATAVQPATLNSALSNTVAESGVFDLSVHNAVNGVPATYASLSAALTALNALSADYKKGGMSVKFIQSSDNNSTQYVQYRYMSTSTAVADFTNVANWQGVDDEPTPESDNLVKSGGIMSGMRSIIQGLNDTQFEENLFDKDTVSSGFLNNDGSLNENSSYSYSDYIPVYKGFTYIVNYLPSTPGCFYDKEKNYISKIPNISSGTNKTFTIPANGYVRVNVLNANKNRLMLLTGSTIPQSYIPYNFSTKENAFFDISQIHNNGNPLSIDDEPTADSDNLVKSGGVVSGISVGANTVINGSRERIFEVGNLYNKSTSAPNIIDNTGSEIESNYIHSDYIPVYKGVQYVFSYLLSTPGGFYDESKNWISKLPNNSGSTINEATFIPNQDGYVRVNLSANNDNYIVTFGNKIPEDILPYGTCTNNKAFFNINQITDFENFSPLKGQYGNLFNKDTISPGLINNNGSITESDTYSYSDYIAVKKGNTYIATSLFSSAGGFYDTNKNWVSNINRSSYGDYKIFVIEQDGYVRVNLYTSRKDTFILSIGTELRDYPVGDKLICPELIINKNQIKGSRWEGKKLVCIGDSITDAGTWVDTLGNMLGTITYNRGKSGSSFAKNPNRQDSFCHRADLPASDEAGHGLGFPTEADLVFVLGGANDWGMDLPTGAENAAIDTNTTCGAIHYLIRNLKDRYPNAKIVFGIPYRIWSPTGAFPSWNEITFNDANDETAGFEYRTNTSGKTFDQIRQSIEKICSMYGIGTISLLNCGFSFWKTTDREMYSLQRELHDVTINGDGLHPSEAGSNVIAKYLCNELNLLAL